MLKNYFNTAFRNLYRNKLYASVSALGLAMGLAACILAIRYLAYELSFDKWPDSSRTYEVVSVQNPGGHVTEQGNTPPGLATAMREDIPGIETSTAFLIRTLPVRWREHDIFPERFCVIDSSFRFIFPMQYVKGSALTSLKDHNSVVITQKLAAKLFGTEEPIGKVVAINGHDCIVRGLIRNLPETSSFSFDGILSRQNKASYPFDDNLSWMRFADILTFVKLISPSDIGSVSAKLPGFVKATGGSPDFESLKLLPLRKIHFATYLSPLVSTYEIKYLYIFSLLASLVLAVSVFNFVGINITVLARRTKEIGIRKVTGATRRDLTVQFLVENVFLTIIAFASAICIAELASHWFDSMLGLAGGPNISILNSTTFILLLCVLLFDVVLSVYATRILASAKINLLVQGENDRFRLKRWVREVLITSQFAIAAFLIICTLVVVSQMNFISHKNLGFDKRDLLLVDNAGTQSHAEILKNTLLENLDVLDVSETRWLLTTGYYLGVSMEFDNGHRPITLHFVQVDQNFVPTLGLELVRGRNFNPLVPSDSGAAIVNEETLRELNISHPFRDSIRFGGEAFKVVGVVRDFNYSSLRNHVEPFVFQFANADPPSLAVRIRKGKAENVLSYLREEWKEINPDKDLKYSFLDRDLNKLYVSDDRMLDALLSGSLVAILISLMGIFALSSFLAETKTKEIAVRKVLGSSVRGIIGLLSFDFMRVVLIANVVAWPAAYLVMREWLQEFAYRIGIDLWIFPIVSLLMITLALLTVLLRVLRTARANPVEALRYE